MAKINSNTKKPIYILGRIISDERLICKKNPFVINLYTAKNDIDKERKSTTIFGTTTNQKRLKVVIEKEIIKKNSNQIDYKFKTKEYIPPREILLIQAFYYKKTRELRGGIEFRVFTDSCKYNNFFIACDEIWKAMALIDSFDKFCNKIRINAKNDKRRRDRIL